MVGVRDGDVGVVSDEPFADRFNAYIDGDIVVLFNDVVKLVGTLVLLLIVKFTAGVYGRPNEN